MKMKMRIFFSFLHKRKNNLQNLPYLIGETNYKMFSYLASGPIRKFKNVIATRAMLMRKDID